MINTTAISQTDAADRRIRWGRIVIGAVLLEAVLVALAVPLLPLVDSPLSGGAADPSKDFTVFFLVVSAAACAVGALAGWWVARPLSARFVLHGTATGLVATAIYLGICSIPPGTIPKAVAAYGAFWFLVANGLRIIGAVLGASVRAIGSRDSADSYRARG
jgi:Kef-type K+ transport system membrane component KefB